jgi:hypothetical protein
MSSTMHDLHLAALAFLGGLCAVGAALLIATRRPRAPEHNKARSAELHATAERWIALPGNVIELGASGFRITLNIGGAGYLYSLHAPEGRLLHQSHDLPAVKALGARLSAERDEFVCRERVAAAAMGKS